MPINQTAVEEVDGEDITPASVDATTSGTDGSVTTGEIGITNFGVSVTLSSSQTVSTGTVTKLQFDVEDVGSGFDTSNFRYVVPESGDYLISGGFRFASDSGWSTGDKINAILRVNGADLFDVNNTKAGTGSETSLLPSRRFSLGAGDIVTLAAFHNSGSDKTVLNGSTRSKLSIVRFT